jgi:hypothetical protein
VQWKGYEDSAEPNMWIYYTDLVNSKEAIHDFYRKYPDRIRPRALKVIPPPDSDEEE